jgi:hypothetical protein
MLAYLMTRIKILRTCGIIIATVSVAMSVVPGDVTVGPDIGEHTHERNGSISLSSRIRKE